MLDTYETSPSTNMMMPVVSRNAAMRLFRSCKRLKGRRLGVT